MSSIAYLAGVLKGDGYLYRGQTGRPRFQVETMSKISQGTARMQVYHNQICYRVAIYNKKVSLLHRVQQFVAKFGLEMKLRNYDSRVPFLELQNRAGVNKFLATFGGKA